MAVVSLAVLAWLTGCGSRGADSEHACSGTYPQQGTSAYVLPFSVGSSFAIGQGNCTGVDDSHAAGTDDEFAYDIDMPIGTSLIASRAGTVQSVEERYRDGNRTPGQENFVTVAHDDGSVGVYFHLTHDGVFVEVGDTVGQGEPIAASGDTGDSTEPHLHFQVDRADGEGSVPVVFRNTRANPRGLVEGESYRAEPF